MLRLSIFSSEKEINNDCIFKYSKLTQWLGFIDIDEFIVPLKKNSIYEILQPFEKNRGAVKLYWKMFGTSGQLERNLDTLISVLFPGISAVNDDMIAVKKITRKSVRIMAYIVFPISLGLMVAGDTIVKVLFTEKWLPMLPYVYVTCVETIISVPATIALQPIKAVGRSDLMLKFEIIKKVFFIVSTIVAMNFGVFAIALTVPANTLLDLIINANINKKLINYSFFEELSDCLAALILSLIMAVVVAFIGKIEFNIYIKVVIQIMVGGLCYAGLSYLTRNKEFSYILNVGMKHFKKA